MAKVTLTLTDGPGGVLVNLKSDEPLPEDDTGGGTVAQNLALIALHIVQREFKDITGKELVPISVH